MLAQLVKHSSLELNWLSSVDKQYSIPKVVFTTGGENSGVYYQSEPLEYLIGQIYVPFDTGVIVVEGDDTISIANTLAHEWRHHWQRHNGFKWKPKSWNDMYARVGTYEKAIREYYHTQWWEMDALMFSARHGNDVYTEYWMELVEG